MKRIAALAYGGVNYLGFLLVTVYLVGFLQNWFVPKSIDSGVPGDVTAAVIVNSLLIVLFGLQHTIMARPTFKRVWTKIVPHSIERSTYVLLSNVILAVLFWLWRPLPVPVWQIENSIGRNLMYGVFFTGLLLVPVATFLINHFDLFGLRQVWLNFKGRTAGRLHFATPGLYRLVRHPLYVGWMLTFWATPVLSHGHMLFAALMTAYMLIAINFEERNLVDEFGSEYEEYRKRTPMLIPRLARSSAIRDHLRTPSPRGVRGTTSLLDPG